MSEAGDTTPSAREPRAEETGSLVRELSGEDLVAAVPAEERAAAEAVDYPMVYDDVEQGVPLSRRLHDPRTIVSFIVPIGVLLLVFAALPGFNLEQLPSLILSANPWWLLAAVAVYYLGFPLRGYRWALLVRGIGYPLKVRDSTEIIFLSWLVNCVVPAKLGDVYRAYLLRVNYLVSMSRTFGTVFIERVLDLIAIVVLGLAAGFWSFRDGMSDQLRIIFGIGLAVVAVLCIGLLVVRGFGRRALVRLPIPHRVVELYDRFEEGVFSVDRRTLPIVIVVTGLIWTTEALRLLFVIEALGFPDVHLGISGAFFVALVASLLTAIPFTPAGLGVVELGIVGILTAFYDVPRTEALAIALLDRAISVLSIILFGGVWYLFSPKTKPRSQPPAAAAPDSAASSASAASD